MDNDIVKMAREWIGTPFHHQGRVKGVGVDCIGLIVGCVQELGYPVIDSDGYGREPAHGILQKALSDQLELSSELKHGDIILFRFVKEPQHVAIYTKDNTIIHAYSKVKKCIEHRLDASWSKRIVNKYQLKKL